MFAIVSVQLPPDTLRRLTLHLNNNGEAQEIGDIVLQAIDTWLAAADRPPTPVLHGYQWKSLFLPEGTQLRMLHGQEYVYASVVGDNIVFNNRAVSPRQLVNSVCGTVRNAWKELWICCPGDARWHLAHTRRTILRRVLPAPVDMPGAHAPHVAGATPPAERDWGANRRDSWTRRYLFAWRHRRYLHRDDAVRDDQPDLGKAGAGPGSPGKSYVPGRSGPRDRRAGGYPRPVAPTVPPDQASTPPGQAAGHTSDAAPAWVQRWRRLIARLRPPGPDSLTGL